MEKMTKRLTECERRWRQRTHSCSHNHTPRTQTHRGMDRVTGWLHDLVSDKCSRITGSQCYEMIINQSDDVLPVFGCRVIWGIWVHFGAVATKQRSAITSPALAKQRKWQMCAVWCVVKLRFTGEGSDNFTPFHRFNVVTFLSWPEDPSLVSAKGCFLEPYAN